MLSRMSSPVVSSVNGLIMVIATISTPTIIESFQLPHITSSSYPPPCSSSSLTLRRWNMKTNTRTRTKTRTKTSIWSTFGRNERTNLGPSFPSRYSIFDHDDDHDDILLSSYPKSFPFSKRWHDDFDDDTIIRHHHPNNNNIDEDVDQFNYEHELEDDDDDGVDLSFLPLDLFDLPPETEDLLRRIISNYIRGDDTATNNNNNNNNDNGGGMMLEALETIDSEYRYKHRPCSIHNLAVLTADENGEDDVPTSKLERKVREYVSKVLSFAALHYLPEGITVMLLDVGIPDTILGGEEVDEGERRRCSELLHRFKIAFRDGQPPITNNNDNNNNEEQEENDAPPPPPLKGWKTVCFPRGLSVHLKRTHLVSKRSKYSPLPRNTLLTRKHDAVEAKRIIHASSLVLPPPTKKMLFVRDGSRRRRDMMEGIRKMETELISDAVPSKKGESSPSSLSSAVGSDDDWSLKEMLTFFPTKGREQTWRHTFLRSMGKVRRSKGVTGGLVAASAWYVVKMAWRWRRGAGGVVAAGVVASGGGSVVDGAALASSAVKGNVISSSVPSFLGNIIGVSMSACIGFATMMADKIPGKIGLFHLDGVLELVRNKIGELSKDRSFWIMTTTACAGAWFGLWAMVRFVRVSFAILRAAALYV